MSTAMKLGMAVAALCVALGTPVVQAVPVQSVADSSVPLGGTTPNAGCFLNSVPSGPPQNVGGVTTSLKTPQSQGPTPQTLVFNVVDDATGADFDYSLTFTCFSDDGSTQTATRSRLASAVLAVDSTAFGDDRNAIESAASTGSNWSEFARLTISDVTVNSLHIVTPIGFDSFVLRNIAGADDAGQFLDAVTGALLGTWTQDTDDYYSPVSLTTATSTSLDVVPTGGKMQVKGFRATFDVTQPGEDLIPEPATMSLLGIGLAASALAARRRRASR